MQLRTSIATTRMSAPDPVKRGAFQVTARAIVFGAAMNDQIRVLLVEDNPLNQAVARGILEHAGATLDVAGDGQQALDVLRSDAQRYDIVLMDMQMPVLDGFSATAAIRSDLALRLPVIAMTAGVLSSNGSAAWPPASRTSSPSRSSSTR